MIDVTCALIRNEEKEILVVQRGEGSSNSLKWEFPGGKIESGESPEECLVREIKEELSMDIIICGRISHVVYDYGVKQIKLIPFICDTLDELPVLSEHLDFKWITPEELLSFNLSEADIQVACHYLETLNIFSESVDPPVTVHDESMAEDNDLRDLIRRTKSLKEAEWVSGSAVENPGIFLKLIEYSYSEDEKLAFRSSWIISKIFDRKPELVYPHLENLIESLDRIDNESTQRSFLRILSLSDLSEIKKSHHGILADHCMNAINSGFSAVAIKAYSMEIVYKLALIYPELANELSVSILMLQKESAAGIKVRGRIILKKLAGIKAGTGACQE